MADLGDLYIKVWIIFYYIGHHSEVGWSNEGISLLPFQTLFYPEPRAIVCMEKPAIKTWPFGLNDRWRLAKAWEDQPITIPR
jgi:hypothetical protein